MSRELVIGGIYKHFKDKLYQVKCVAYHSETKEKMVVYQALYGDYSVYVRPYEMFLSEVDHVKYPEVMQKYRFEQVDLKKESCVAVQEKEVPQEENAVQEKEVPQEENAVQGGNSVQEEVKTSSGENEQAEIIENFLDAYGYDKKLDVLMKSRTKITDGMIDVMAESLEIVVPAGDILARYESLKKCLMAHTKYEGARLRQK